MGAGNENIIYCYLIIKDFLGATGVFCLFVLRITVYSRMALNLGQPYQPQKSECCQGNWGSLLGS